MTTDIKLLDSIDTRTKFTVSGYIREERIVLDSSKCQLFQNIPSIVPYLCTLYYDPDDYFVGDGNAAISMNGKKILELYGETRARCNGSVIVSSDDKCIYEWTLKMHELATNIGTCVVVGIAATDAIFGDTYDDMEGEFYMYSNYGWALKNDDELETPDAFLSGDEVKIEMNLIADEPFVKFYKNGNGDMEDGDNVLIMNEIEETIEYTLVVVVYKQHVKASIEKFMQISVTK